MNSLENVGVLCCKRSIFNTTLWSYTTKSFWLKQYKFMLYFEAFLIPWKKYAYFGGGGGFPPFYYNMVYHKLIYIHYYPFFSMMLIFFNKYISSWCLEPLLLFVVHRWSGGRIFFKKNFFTPCSCFTPFYYLLSFQCTHWQKQMFYIFCLIEVNMA